MGADTTDYTYDPVGRLTRAQTTGANASDFQYAYDSAGNRTSQTINGGTPTSYSYNAANQMTAAGAITYSYDANGNLTGNSAGMSLSYNAADQTTSITPAGGPATAMTYTGEGQSDRTQAGPTAFTANALGLGYETTAGASIYYTRTPTGELIGQRHPTGRHYLLTDGIGSVAKVIDASGAVVTAERYDPFGTTAASSGTLANVIKFAGEYKDPSGLYKIGERYFDPERGVWTQEDPIVQHNAYGTYSYANSDPVNNVDPSGEAIWSRFCVWMCRAITSGARAVVPVVRWVSRAVCVAWTTRELVSGVYQIHRYGGQVRRVLARAPIVGTYCAAWTLVLERVY